LTIEQTVKVAKARVIDYDETNSLETMRMRANPEALPLLLEMLRDEGQRENWSAILATVKYVVTPSALVTVRAKMEGFLGELDVHEYEYVLGYIDILAREATLTGNDQAKTSVDEVLSRTHWRDLKFQLRGIDNTPSGMPDRETFLAARMVHTLKRYGAQWKTSRDIAAAAIRDEQQAKVFNELITALCGGGAAK